MKHLFLLSIAPLAVVSAAVAQAAPTAQRTGDGAESADAETASRQVPVEEVFSTGVAKGRDRLDSATSTSSIKAATIETFGARSLAEVLRNIPGIRAESASGEGNASYSIRGLPLASNGSKFMQLQEDGLPVLEFGDLLPFAPDVFMRVDLNLAQIEAIRGGSASTFASNSPGGVINLISRTGDVEGGAIQATFGLDYGEHRIDADYGGKLSDSLRFHIGGFYRRGEGPRIVGYDAYRGGQVKFNVTRQFAGGYVRVYGKYLDDRTPSYQPLPASVSGTNADPDFANVANLDLKTDTLLSRNNLTVYGVDGQNRPRRSDVRDGQHGVVKAIGLEAQVDVGGWAITEKFRFADISARIFQTVTAEILAAPIAAFAFGGPGARLSYATGPAKGQAIANPATLNGNGLIAVSAIPNFDARSLDNTTNDIRASRVWSAGGGNLTTTVGFYKSIQAIEQDQTIPLTLSDVRGNGQAALIDVTTAGGFPTTQDGYLLFGQRGGSYQRNTDVRYHVDAPYGSINYHIGKVAIGGSVRYDFGTVRGTLFGADLGGGRVGNAPVDVNGDGRISLPESAAAVVPLTRPGKVDYDYGYLSYSTGINYRVAEPLAVFARYSRGGRAAADRVLFTPAIDATSGKLIDPADGFDIVRQTELGLKLRRPGLTFNVTGFAAKAGDRNLQINSKADGTLQIERIVRNYDAKGVELEGGLRHGVFSITAGGTYTEAKIAKNPSNPAFVGNAPRHQAHFIFEATPQVDFERATIGANIVGTTGSYAQDSNQLKMPGYTLVNAFVQLRPIDRVQVMLNVNNLFDTLALVEVTQATIPVNGVVFARAMTGRTLSGTLRYSF